MVLPLARQLVEIPPGNAVHRGRHRCIRAEQRLHRIHDTRRLIGFQRHNHAILRSQGGRVACHAGMGNEFLVPRDEPETVHAHRFQMSAAGDEADIMALPAHHRAQMPAYRARAIYRDFHVLTHSLT